MADDKTEDTTIESTEVEATTEPVEQEVEATEEETTDVEETEEVEAPVADEPIEEPEAPEPQPSYRENKRIAELTRKLAEAQHPAYNPPQLPRQNIAEGDYDVDQLNGMFQQGTQEAYQAGLAQANAIGFTTDLKIEAPRVAQKYEFMNQDSEHFDPGAAALLNEKYLKIVGYNPNNGTVQNNNIGYEEFIDAEVELAQLLNRSASADSSRNLAKQAAQTGVRPNSVNKKNYQGTDPSKMTLDQLQAAALQEAKQMRF